MLGSLHIENIAVIRRLDVEFSRGFHAFTGETGAGKSILIDSIRLLLGGRGDKELVRTGEDRAFVSALFLPETPDLVSSLRELGIPAEEGEGILLERTLHADGRTGAKNRRQERFHGAAAAGWKPSHRHTRAARYRTAA